MNIFLSSKKKSLLSLAVECPSTETGMKGTCKDIRGVVRLQCARYWLVQEKSNYLMCGLPHNPQLIVCDSLVVWMPFEPKFSIV